ncbi:hypothetical protein [Moraxella bovis]|uniref:hypothetical protein n=1 Tax=Moraxella bovis TaxID=476 RepID=UPI0022279B31|nr:hypothetical protein [Moraxella bovis]UYZ86586.1 hypothetical protein LP094_12860 [Moraxella bovis]
MIDIDYLQKVVNALNAHADKNDCMATLFLQAHELKGDTMYQDHAIICLEHAKQLREHGGYIQEVIDEPHLLVKQ